MVPLAGGRCQRQQSACVFKKKQINGLKLEPNLSNVQF